MDVSIKDRGVFAFGPFRLDPVRRTLRRDGAALKLSPRLFDTLLLLVEHAGQLVEKDELLAQVWGGRIVEESNLSRAIFELRKVLAGDADADGYIVTAPGRGYRFAASVRLESGAPQEAASPGADMLVAAKLPGVPAPPVFTQEAPVAVTPVARRRAPWALGGAAALAVCGAVAWRAGLVSPAPAAAPRLSLVVLPFAGSGGTVDLADALRDDLTTDLSHIPGSLVIARQSADAVAAKGLPADAIGRALNVRYLLSGRMRGEAGGRQVNAQLVDAASGKQIWAQRFDLGAGPVWEAEAGIVHQITSALDGVLVEAEVARAANARPHDEDALDLFFRARAVLRRSSTLDALTTAQTMLEAAVRKQPDFVDALVELGVLLVRKEQGFSYPTWSQDQQEAGAVLGHALQLQPQSDAVLAARGRMLAATRHYSEAEASFAEALANNPSNVQAIRGESLCAWVLGHLDKVAPLAAQGLRLDPTGPEASSAYKRIGLAALFAGDTASAIDNLMRYNTAHASAAVPADSMTPVEEGRLFAIAAEALAGDIATARAHYADYRKIWPNRSVWRVMAPFTPAQHKLPGFVLVENALVAAGMPRFADADSAASAGTQGVAITGGDYTATPPAAPGAVTIDTAELQKLLAAHADTIVADYSNGSAAPPGVVMLTSAPQAFIEPAMTEQALMALPRPPDSATVVMADGPFGVDGYNAVLRLAGSLHTRLYWYRGGEEAWARAGLNAQDRRAQ